MVKNPSSTRASGENVSVTIQNYDDRALVLKAMQEEGWNTDVTIQMEG
ncbi:MAG: hypothetical protein V8S25_05980 [Faecalibacterium prausnitzii]